MTIRILREHTVLPGFGIAWGFTVLYLCLVVLIPLSTLFLASAKISLPQFWGVVSTPRAVASYELSFGTALASALVNAGFGFLVAWVLVRYRFPGKTLIDSMVDLPFALPTAVGGVALTTAYTQNGVIGGFLASLGVQVAFTRIGVMVALIFIGLPFVVRTVEPVIQDLDREVEEAAATLGASRWSTFARVLLPGLGPAIITGATLSFARALGEYGTVIFISGNLPLKTEITPFLIMSKLEQFDYVGATALALFMLVVSFGLLLAINLLQRWSSQRVGV